MTVEHVQHTTCASLSIFFKIKNFIEFGMYSYDFNEEFGPSPRFNPKFNPIFIFIPMLKLIGLSRRL